MLNKYTKIAKDLGNIRELNPTLFLDHLTSLFYRESYTDYKVLDGIHFPLLSRVAAGGQQQPKVLLLNASHFKEANVVLIGKGILFDSGGIQSKGDDMGDMFFDKLGATTVISYCLKNRNIPALVYLTNNLTGHTSYVPHEIITAYNGKRVFISHTDAEGRLGLADLLAYAQKENRKAHKVTLATLTGGAVYFTGANTTALLHSVDDNLKKELISSSVELWPAPTHKQYREAVLCKVKNADIQTLPTREDEGACSQVGYEFLKHFAKNLIHIDMAAMGVDKDSNATGWGIRELHFIVKYLTRKK